MNFLLSLLWLFLCYRCVLHGFRDVRGLHISSMVHGFLESLWFKGFLRGSGKRKFLCGFMLLVVLDVFGLWTDDLGILRS